LIVQKSRQHAFENFLYFYETKNDIYHGKVKKNTGNKAYNNLKRGMYNLYTNKTTNEWLRTLLSFEKGIVCAIADCDYKFDIQEKMVATNIIFTVNKRVLRNEYCRNYSSAKSVSCI